MIINKKFLLILIFVFIFIAPANAEKFPIRITPASIISTNKDEVEIGDWLRFTITNDVYVNEKLYIKEKTPIVGFVAFVHENGFCGDNAQIVINKFITKDVNAQKVVIPYKLVISGDDQNPDAVKNVFKIILASLFRGQEIYLMPNENVYNIFIDVDN